MIERRRGEATRTPNRSKSRPEMDQHRAKNKPKSTPTRSKIDDKSFREPLGRSWAIRGALGALPGRSRAPRNLPGTLRRPPRARPKRPGATEKRTRECSRRLFRALQLHAHTQTTPGTIFGRFLIRFRALRRQFRSTGPVFREGRAFFVGTPARTRKRPKIDRKRSPNAPPSAPYELLERSGGPPSEPSRAQFSAGRAIF